MCTAIKMQNGKGAKFNMACCSSNQFFVLTVPDDLTPEEQQELENIRRHKQELLEDIQVMPVFS